MSLFSGIKNAMEEHSRGKEHIEERVAAIARLKQILGVGKNHILSRILDECGGMEQLYISNGNYKKEKLVSRFRLPDDEVIILYVSWRQGLLGTAEPRFLMTDHAVYYIQSSGNDVRRLDFFSITQYILVYSLDKQNVCLVNESEDSIICTKGAIKRHLSKSDEALVVSKILAMIQEEIIAADKSTKNNRSALFHWICSRINKNLRTVGISKTDAELLENMKRDKAYKDLCSLMLLKGYLYANEHIFFNVTLKEMEKPGAQEQRVLIKFEEVVSRYVAELKDSSVDFSEKCLEDVDLYVNKNPQIFDDGWNYSEFQKKMIALYNRYATDISYYNTIRRKPQIPVLDIIQTCYARGIGDEKRKEYIFTSLVWHNRSMKHILERVECGQNPDKRQVLWKDGMGLTALHYAMLLGKRDVVGFCISNMPDFGLESTDKDYEMSDVRSYGIVAVLTGMYDLLDVLAEKTEEAAPLLKTRKALSRNLNIWSRTRQAALTAVRMVEMRLNSTDMDEDSDDVEQVRDDLEKLYSQIAYAEEMITELGAQLKEVEDDIKAVSRVFVERYREMASKIENSKSPFERYFFHIYSNPQSLKKLLECITDDFQVYDYCGQFILLSTHIGNLGVGESGAAESTSFENKGNYSAFQKPYGANWFSPEAHEDLSVMGKEYHKLAAKYHPDCNPDAIALFLDIQDERAAILDYLSKRK